MDAMHGMPLWLTGLTSAGLVFGFLGAGFLVGRRHGRLEANREAGPVGAAAAACLGLLAFLLGFTFNMAASRLDARKALVLDESNAIGTAWLRADLLDGTSAPLARQLLEDYVDVRLGVDGVGNLAAALDGSKRIHTALWSLAVRNAERSTAARLFVQAINDVIDLHTKRVVFGLQYRIPPPIWTAIVLVTAMAMASLGYLFGLSGMFRYPVSIAMATAFGVVILLIADIDRPAEGYVRVDLQPLRDLRADLRIPAAAAGPPD